MKLRIALNRHNVRGEATVSSSLFVMLVDTSLIARAHHTGMTYMPNAASYGNQAAKAIKLSCASSSSSSSSLSSLSRVMCNIFADMEIKDID